MFYYEKQFTEMIEAKFEIDGSTFIPLYRFYYYNRKLRYSFKPYSHQEIVTTYGLDREVETFRALEEFLSRELKELIDEDELETQLWKIAAVVAHIGH